MARSGTPPSFIQRPGSDQPPQDASCAQCQGRPTATNCSWQPSKCPSNLPKGASGLLQIRENLGSSFPPNPQPPTPNPTAVSFSRVRGERSAGSRKAGSAANRS